MKIRKVESKVLKNEYYGMNSAANKELKTHIPIKTNEILIDKNLKGRILEKTIAHEKEELYLMTKKHLPYNKADHIARMFEKHLK